MPDQHLVRARARAATLLAICLAACLAASPSAAEMAAGPVPIPAERLDERIADASMVELQAGLAAGAWTSADLTSAYLRRIEAFDPQIGAVIAVNPDALRQAGEQDRERAAGNVRGPLHGIPIILKDNIESRDPLPTTAGSLALADNRTARDAHLVARLREAGVVILGKSNLSEWANFRSTRSSSGWSAVGGQTHNPYDLTRNPCGSSSGSGAAVAAGFAAAAIGTETNGSIVCPSSANGIVGIKPTVGLVSRFGIVPISHTQDTAGPMAGSVRDATLLLQAMIGSDRRDPRSALADEVADWQLVRHLREDGLRGKRIGVLRSAAGFHSEVDALFEQAVRDLGAAGAVVIDDLAFPEVDGLDQAAYEVLLYEFKHDLNAYLAALPTLERLPARDLAGLIEFNEQYAERELHWFGQEIFLAAQERGGLEEQTYQEALALTIETSRKGIDELLAEHDLHALIAPTGSPAWKTDRVNGDHFLGSSSSYPARAGYPNVTVPMGQVHGLPVGLSVFGTALAEPVLLEIAYAYEQATQHRRTPEMSAPASGNGPGVSGSAPPAPEAPRAGR